MKSIKRILLSFIAAITITLGGTAVAQDKKLVPEGNETLVESAHDNVQAETDKVFSDRREEILKEAENALAKTKDALTALEEKRSDEALAALAEVTGELEIIVARDPELALAPIDTHVMTYDLLASKETIETAIEQANDVFKDGDIPEARRLLDVLRSEVVISVDQLPLATYPDAITAIAPLIDEGKIDEAKESLQTALNTIVVSEHVVPLPVLRAEALLDQAEELTVKAGRSEEENEELGTLLSEAHNQLEMAELLGYGSEDEYKDLYAQLFEIESSTSDGKSGTGFFDGMKESMSGLWDSISS